MTSWWCGFFQEDLRPIAECFGLFNIAMSAFRDLKLMHTCIIHEWLSMHPLLKEYETLNECELISESKLCKCSHFPLYFWVHVNVLCPIKVNIVFLVWWLFTSSHTCWLLSLGWVTNIEHGTSNVSLYKYSLYHNRDKYESITNTKKYKGKHQQQNVAWKQKRVQFPKVSSINVGDYKIIFYDEITLCTSNKTWLYLRPFSTIRRAYLIV